MVAQITDDLIAQPKGGDDRGRTLFNRRQQLVQAIIEAEGQEGQNAVATGDVQIGAHDARAGQKIAVRQHHALGRAGGAGGIKNGGQVFADCR